MTTGVLPYRTFKDDVLANTGFFECSSTSVYTQQGTSSGNHDQAGMSMGSLQYNFGSANRLKELWQFMINNHEQDCIDAFGTNTTEYQTWKTAVMSAVQQDRLDFGANITDPNNSHAVIQPYKDVFVILGNKQSHIDKYKSMADAYYFPPPEKIFLSASCVSRLAYASYFDAYINKGRFYPVNLVQADFDKIDADTTIDAAEKERQKIYQINYRANYDNAVNPNVNAWGTIDQNTFWHGDGVDDGRRGCMANQTGNYYGLTYDPDVQFDMNQEPAMTEKASTIGAALGANQTSNLYLGSNKINKIYLGAQLLGSAPAAPTSAAVPQTQFRTNPASYAGIGAATSVSLTAGQKLWVDCQESPAGTLVSCRTYFTIDGSTPTTSSTLYDKALTFDASCTLKTLTVSTSGVAEAVKTLTVTVAVAPVTTISPSATVQNTIPFTVTLTTSESGATIHYKIGSGADTVYTGPFTVNQTNVNSASIPITYWSVGTTATEAQRTITYDTSGSIPATPTLTATAGSGKVDLSWTASQNATSFTIYRSTVAGTLGTWIGTTQYYGPATLTYSDTGLTAGTTYYYTIRANNYGTFRDSVQKSGIPTAAPTKPTYRYIRIDGWGEYNAGTPNANFRPVGLEVWSGGIDRLNGKTGTSEGGVDFMLPSGFVTAGTNTVTWMTDHGATVPSATTNYAGYWDALNANGNAFIKYDMGAAYPIDSIKYWNYSASGVQKSQRFRIYGTNNLANFGTSGALIGTAGIDYELLYDYSTNQTVFPLSPNHFVTKTF